MAAVKGEGVGDVRRHPTGVEAVVVVAVKAAGKEDCFRQEFPGTRLEATNLRAQCH